MPLNYSKWDQLELSDDSDIEGHPNVDKKSLVRWKQRDIHEKRLQRKHKITSLSAEIDCNAVLLPRLQKLHSDLTSNDAPPAYFNSLVDKLKTNPSPDAPPTNAPGQPTYDAMMLSLLLQVGEASRKKVAESGGGDHELAGLLAKGINDHVDMLHKEQERLSKELEAEEKEQKKHITSDDLHDGFSNKYVPPAPAPPPVPHAKVDKPKKTETTYEVLNKPTPSTTASSTSTTATPDPDEDQDTDALPELTPDLEAFSRLPLWAYATSWSFIQSHRGVIVPGAADALLVAAFRAQTAGQAKHAKQCVHQSLLLQYCEKLGSDGVRVFFQKMVSGDKRAEPIFTADVEKTYEHLVSRVAASLSEPSPPAEQIQLVPSDPSSTISFNVPSGPPPPHLTLEGPGTEGLDVEEVRKALQLRWDVFCGFGEEMQAALKEGSLEGVNKVLAEMSVEEAEKIVEALDAGGILSFVEGGIRDETAGGAEEDEEEEEEEGEAVGEVVEDKEG